MNSNSTSARRAVVGVGVVAALVLAADLGTKAWALGHGARSGWADVVHNPETTLGTVGGSPTFLVLLSALGIVVAAAWALPRVVRGSLPALAVGAALGGALGNLVDRAVRGHVTDFVPLGDLIVVNVADLAVVAGILALIAASARRARTTPRG